MTGRLVVLYDGDCRVCTCWARWVARHDRADRLRFAALQSDAGQAILRAHGLPLADWPTLYVVRGDGAVLDKSEAMLAVGRALPPPWSWGALARGLPRAWRDAAYDRIAEHRGRIPIGGCRGASALEARTLGRA